MIIIHLMNPKTSRFVLCVFGKMMDFNLTSQTLSGGANDICLNEARENYKKFGAMKENYLDLIRPPLPEEMIDPDKKNDDKS